MNEQEQKAIESIAISLEVIHTANQALLNSLNIPSIHKDIESLTEDWGCDFDDWQNFELISSPSGEKTEDSYGAIQEVYFDQHGVGYHGDTSYGDLYLKVGESKFLKLGYRF